jgi:hypothetical protein
MRDKLILNLRNDSVRSCFTSNKHILAIDFKFGVRWSFRQRSPYVGQVFDSDCALGNLSV